MREKLKDHPAGEAIPPSAAVMAFDLCARGFNELVVLHAGGAGGHAGHATETAIEVGDESFVHHADFAFGGGFHQVNAAARRIHFFVPENVSGAGGQAEAAVAAVADEFVIGRMMRVEEGLQRNRIVRMEAVHLEASEEAPGTEGTLGIELLLDARHERESGRALAEDVEDIFDFPWGLQENESAAEFAEGDAQFAEGLDKGLGIREFDTQETETDGLRGDLGGKEMGLDGVYGVGDFRGKHAELSDEGAGGEERLAAPNLCGTGGRGCRCELGTTLQLSFDAFGEAFEADIDDGRSVGSGAQLHARGNEGGVGDGEHVVVGGGGVSELEADVTNGVRQRIGAQSDFGENAEGAVGTDEKLGKIVTGDVLDDASTAAGEGAVGENHRDTEEKIAKAAERVGAGHCRWLKTRPPRVLRSGQRASSGRRCPCLASSACRAGEGDACL